MHKFLSAFGPCHLTLARHNDTIDLIVGLRALALIVAVGTDQNFGS
jgi:hypothetical protein